ncbi:MAG: SURF1 family protein [Acidiferrobacterales bacterium]
MSLRHYRPKFIPTLAVVILLPVLVGLGFWQLDRAQQKRAIQAEYDTRSSDARIEIGSRQQYAEDLRFYRVIAHGAYEPDYQVLIDNRVLHGRVGYHVITPLRIRHSEVRVLVNRGWVPMGRTRDDLPAAGAPTGMQEIKGIATVPRAQVFMLAEPAPLTGRWQKVWQHMDMRRYAEAVPFPIQPVVILLDPDSPAGGFLREWARLDAGIAVHQGYAFQWFALAAALLVIYIVLTVRAAKRKHGAAGG